MNDTFAARLRVRREAARLSVPELAAAAGLTRQAVWQLERGEREPTLETARKLAAALACTIDELAGASGQLPK